MWGARRFEGWGTRGGRPAHLKGFHEISVHFFAYTKIEYRKLSTKLLSTTKIAYTEDRVLEIGVQEI